MIGIKRVFCAAIIALLSNAVLFGAFHLLAYIQDMFVDEFIKYLLFIILPLGYVLFTVDGTYGKICKIAGFLLVVVPTLVYHFGLTYSPESFYLSYMILPISWWTLAVLLIHEYKGNDIEIEGWVILCSIVTLMMVLVIAQYIIIGTPGGPERFEKAINACLIAGGIALATLGIVCLKIRKYKKYSERTRRPGAQLAQSPLPSGSNKYYCHDCKHFEFFHDDHGIIRYYCKLDKLERTYGEMQCSNRFVKRW